MIKKMACAAAAVLAMSSFAAADPADYPMETLETDDSGLYLGLVYTYMAAESVVNVDGRLAGYPVDAEITLADGDINTLMLQVGYQLNAYIAAEGRYWFGGSNTVGTLRDASGIPHDVTLDADSWGIYLKPIYPVFDALDIYALLGYAGNSYTLSASTANGEQEINPDVEMEGFSWGIGTSLYFGDSLSIFIDYTALYNDETTYTDDLTVDDRIDTVNIGIAYKF